jgi:uncharacterized protein (TIGR02611 family)
MIRRAIQITYKMGRRIVVFVVGFTVLLVGFIMIVTPGPAFVVIPVGLAILSLEFAWAKIWLSRLRKGISDGSSKWRRQRADSRKDEAEKTFKE